MIILYPSNIWCSSVPGKRVYDFTPPPAAPKNGSEKIESLTAQ